MTFTQRVLQIVKKIPKSKVMTYKEIAKKAGSSKASRAVGIIMKKNNDLSVPCHRVIRSDGTIGSYNGLRGKTKQQLLMDERAIK